MPKCARRPRAEGVSTLATILIALAAAMLTAFAAAAIHIVKMSQLRASLEGKRVRLLKYARSMAAGEKIDRRDLVAGTGVREDDAQALGGAMAIAQLKDVVGRRLRQSVNTGEWVQWSHFTTGGHGPPPRTDMVGIMFELDPRKYPPGCKAGDHVNIVAVLQAPNAPPRAYRLIRNVEVLAVDWGTPPPGGPETRPKPQPREAHLWVSVEVHEDVAMKLRHLLDRAAGKVWLEVLPPDTPFDPEKHGIINPDEPILKKLGEREPEAPPAAPA